MNFGANLTLVGGIATSAVVGWLLSLTGVPLAWILGAMAGSAVYANTVGLGGKTKYARRLGQLLIGGVPSATELGTVPARIK